MWRSDVAVLAVWHESVHWLPNPFLHWLDFEFMKEFSAYIGFKFIANTSISDLILQFLQKQVGSKELEHTSWEEFEVQASQPKKM